MKKTWLAAILTCLLMTKAFCSEEVTGFWQTYNNKTKKPTSVIAVYPYQGNYYGRIIATYDDDGSLKDTIWNPQSRAPGIVGKPYYCGLDIVWSARPTKNDKLKGHVFDPRKGRVYNALLWRDGNNLILRGEVLMFGKNMTWPPFPDDKFTAEFKKPDLATFVPKLPVVEEE
jgi:uncharacterized protein (DUF2147 family)